MDKMDIVVDPEVVEFVKRSGEDQRLSTSCSGPIIIPTSFKPPKENDLRIKCGEHTLFISRVQARYINRITKAMIYDPDEGISCSMYPEL